MNIQLLTLEASENAIGFDVMQIEYKDFQRSLFSLWMDRFGCRTFINILFFQIIF